MPTPAATTLQIVKNGGAPASGVVVAAFSDSIVLKLASSSGVSKVRYRIWEYPEGFACPAGWTDSGKLYYYFDAANGANAPAFALPNGSNPDLWGNYMFDAVTNDRLRNGVVDNDLYDNKTCLYIPSLTGIRDICFGESNQFDQFRQYAAALKGALRMFDAAVFVGGGVTDHGALSGLGDDDHPQYVKVDGSRALAGDWSLGGKRLSNAKRIGFGTAPADNIDSGTTKTIDFSNGEYQKLRLTGNCTLTLTPDQVGSVLVRYFQDSTGGRTLTHPGSVSWVGGPAPVMPTAPGAEMLIQYLYDGTTVYAFAPDAGTAYGQQKLWDSTTGTWRYLGILTGTDLTNADETLAIAGGAQYFLKVAVTSTRKKILSQTGATKGLMITIYSLATRANAVNIRDAGDTVTLFSFPASAVPMVATFRQNDSETAWTLSGWAPLAPVV